MVGLDKLRKSSKSCSECNKEGLTVCDNCGLYMCREHSTLIPAKKNVGEGSLQIMHLKCSPSSHRNKMEKIHEQQSLKEVIE
mgnify:CR=1 FL=1